VTTRVAAGAVDKTRGPAGSSFFFNSHGSIGSPSPSPPATACARASSVRLAAVPDDAE
jgi:hypothetical protein